MYNRLMSDISTKVTEEGDNFGQQHILKKGLNKYKERGSTKSAKELDQLHRCTCFSTMDI